MNQHKSNPVSGSGLPVKPPEWAGVSLGPTLAGALYVLLLGAVALALWGRRFPGALPPQLEAASPWVFLVFVGMFAFYRFGLVRAGKYRASKAFFQVGAGLLMFTLLLPSSRTPYQSVEDPVAEALDHSN